MTPTASPYTICKRLVDFASRMPEVKDADVVAEMAGALSEMHRAVVGLVTGRTVDIMPTTSPMEDLAATVSALLLYGSTSGSDRTTDVFTDLSAAIDEMFRGLECNLIHKQVASR